MKKELQVYLMDTFGHQYDNLELDVCASANPFIRFDLGGEDNNEAKVRASQATERVTVLFREVFPADREVTVLMYDYLYADEYRTSGPLKNLFPKGKFTEIYNAVETRIDSDEEDEKVRVIIGKIHIRDIDAHALFSSIANTEMGFEPSLYSRVFFIDTENDTIFYMFDDRGCIVETRDVERIRTLRDTRKDWLSEEYEEKMDRYFTGE